MTLSLRFVVCLLFVFSIGLAEAVAQTPTPDGASFWPTAPAQATETRSSEEDAAFIRDTVGKIRESYRQEASWQCPFTQEYKSKLTKRVTKSEGKVLFERPAKMRWDYDTPERKSFITDGERMWYVLWDAREAKFNPTLKKSSLESSIGFLWGESDLLRDYDILRFSEATVEGDLPVGKRLALELTPKADSQFEYLYLLVNPESFRIEEAVLIDTVGNRNRLIFGTQEKAKAPNTAPFEWSAPKGETWQVETVTF